jgi:hypothetical protein
MGSRISQRGPQTDFWSRSVLVEICSVDCARDRSFKFSPFSSERIDHPPSSLEVKFKTDSKSSSIPKAKCGLPFFRCLVCGWFIDMLNDHGRHRLK